MSESAKLSLVIVAAKRALITTTLCFTLGVLTPKPAKAMEEVVVTAVSVSIVYLLWDFISIIFPSSPPAEHDEISEQGAEDFFDKHQSTSCQSSVEDRAEYAAVWAGFAPAGTVYRINYPGGGWQMWRITGQDSSGRTVAEDSQCYSS